MPFAIEAPQRTYVFIMFHLLGCTPPFVHLLCYSGDIQDSDFAEHICRMASESPSTLPHSSGTCFSWRGFVHELTPLIEVGYRCGGCGRVQTFMKVCGNCRFARYCSEACQRRCWRAHHRHSCRAIRRVHDRSRRRMRPNYYGYMSGYEFHKLFHCLQ